MCTEYSIVRTIRLKNSLMPHKHLKRQNVIQLHQSSDLNSNKTITECLTDKTRHVTAAQCIYNLHHGCGEDFPSRRKPYYTILYPVCTFCIMDMVASLRYTHYSDVRYQHLVCLQSSWFVSQPRTLLLMCRGETSVVWQHYVCSVTCICILFAQRENETRCGEV